MGKVKAVDTEKQAQKAQEKAQKEAERLAKIEAEKAKGQATKGKASSVKGKEEDVIPAKAGIQDDGSLIKSGMTESVDPEAKEPKKVSKYAEKHGAVAQKGVARSKNYLAAAKLVDKAKQYSVKEALELVEKTHLAKFDETVELHINTLSAGINGQVTLPHGTGKTTKVAVLNPSKDSAGADALLKQIEAGKIEFDVLVATPDAMPRLAKVARVLGPRGLMPNPKNGTVTPKPDEVAAKFAGGQMNFKTEAKSPIIHLSVGKLSFGADKLSENIATALEAVKMENIKKVVVKSTMSPAVKLQLGK